MKEKDLDLAVCVQNDTLMCPPRHKRAPMDVPIDALVDLTHPLAPTAHNDWLASCETIHAWLPACKNASRQRVQSARTIRFAAMGFGTVFLGAIFGALACAAQPVQVFTEFVRLDASGKVLAPETPREILSPALIRNGFTSFQVAIAAEKNEHWRLFIGQNPENAVAVTMYRETGQRLDPVQLPVEGDGSAVFWMDVWTGRGAPVARIKIEPQLDYRGDWVIYPIEGRVMEATAGDGPWPAGTQDPVEMMRVFLCAVKASAEVPSPASGPVTLARLRDRNARQDLSLASKAPREEVRKLFGACEASPPDDVEWYLKIRDYLFRMR